MNCLESLPNKTNIKHSQRHHNIDLMKNRTLHYITLMFFFVVLYTKSHLYSMN